MQYVKQGVVISVSVAAFNAGMNISVAKFSLGPIGALLAGGLAAAVAGSVAASFLR